MRSVQFPAGEDHIGAPATLREDPVHGILSGQRLRSTLHALDFQRHLDQSGDVA